MNKKKILLLFLLLTLVFIALRENGNITFNKYNSKSTTYAQPPRWDKLKELEISKAIFYDGTPKDKLGGGYMETEGKPPIMETIHLNDTGLPLEVYVIDHTYASDWTTWIPFYKFGKHKLYIQAEGIYDRRRYGLGIQNWKSEIKVKGICSHRRLRENLYDRAFSTYEKALIQED